MFTTMAIAAAVAVIAVARSHAVLAASGPFQFLHRPCKPRREGGARGTAADTDGREG